MELKNATILVVDDVAANRNLLREILEPNGYEVLLAADGSSAIKAAARAVPDVVLLDVMMPGVVGFETCRQLKANDRTCAIPVMFITAREDTPSTVAAFELGAVDYIVKPFQAAEVLARVKTHLENARLTRALRQKNEELQAEMLKRQRAEASLQSADERLEFITEMEARRWGLAGFVGSSTSFGKIVGELRQLQRFKTTVLILGESGTGKELIARALHYGGPNAKGPFIPVNCSAIPAELLESSFFGHTRGAFTGALSDHKGYFEQASGGTLFLDEIGDMPLALQAKLLRVLEANTVTPVGSVEPRPFEARIIAATNTSLDVAIECGEFRKDLYYRLARFTIEVPPLRDRTDDILPLANHFLELFASEMGCRKPALTPVAATLLQLYDFPGNIRELKNLVERALIVCDGGDISPDHLGLTRLVETAGAEVEIPAAVAENNRRRDRDRMAEDRVLMFVREHKTINNTQCRELLGFDLHQASYFLRKLQRAGKLARDHSRRWAQYRLP
ncbi:MAG: sigma-54 dependent transcriptional regulator [Verrucomicrobiota bacterium]